MLACARIGAIHSVVFGGFASAELATRITDCQPKVLISASAGVEPTRIVPYKPLLDKALTLTTHQVERVVIVQRPHVLADCALGPKDISYTDLMDKAQQPAAAIPLPSTHPHYVLYTSGTTGLPKGVVRDTGGMAVVLKWSMSRFYGMTPGDVFWSASDIGWVVGHSYIVYGPLLHGCTTILYEGKPVGTPDAGAFWRVISEHGVKAMFVAPTAFRAIKQADPGAVLAQQYDLSSLETIFLAGEHSDPETIHWCERAVPHVPPPVDHWWQTECECTCLLLDFTFMVECKLPDLSLTATNDVFLVRFYRFVSNIVGWPAVGNAVGLGRLPVHYGSCSMPVPGFQLEIIDGNGQPLPPNKLGNMVLKTPLPPGALMTIYKDDDRYIREYLTKYPGYYDTGDAAFRDDQGYFHIMGRTDDIINTAGHRLSTGSMEEILMEHEEVADCAVIPVKDSVKGHVPVGLVVCVTETLPTEFERIKTELIELVRDQLGPVASFRTVGVVKALPKTRSGKTLRGTMSKIANGEPYKITPTIEDATIFDTLAPEIVRLMENRKTS
jgi:propionyl-CoA synthetase